MANILAAGSFREFAWVIVIALDIVAIVDVARSSLEPKRKLLWVLLIVFVPMFGVLIYYLLGRK
jgi:hypothetical protein